MVEFIKKRIINIKKLYATGRKRTAHHKLFTSFFKKHLKKAENYIKSVTLKHILIHREKSKKWNANKKRISKTVTALIHHALERVFAVSALSTI